VAKDVTHGCYAVQSGHNHFRCRACSFEGDLAEAIRHCVENQWTVYP
jgi:FAD/FMN-containing dehydrogenase